MDVARMALEESILNASRNLLKFQFQNSSRLEISRGMVDKAPVRTTHVFWNWRDVYFLTLHKSGVHQSSIWFFP